MCNRFGRSFELPGPIEDYSVFYIGIEGAALTNLMLSYSKSPVMRSDSQFPCTCIDQPAIATVAAWTPHYSYKCHAFTCDISHSYRTVAAWMPHYSYKRHAFTRDTSHSYHSSIATILSRDGAGERHSTSIRLWHEGSYSCKNLL